MNFKRNQASDRQCQVLLQTSGSQSVRHSTLVQHETIAGLAGRFKVNEWYKNICYKIHMLKVTDCHINEISWEKQADASHLVCVLTNSLLM